MYVREADHAGGTPLGPYHFKAELATDPDGKLYALDPDVFTVPDGRQYLLWAGDPGPVLYVPRLPDPWTTTGHRQLLAADGFGCRDIREGPCTVQRDGPAGRVGGRRHADRRRAGGVDADLPVPSGDLS